VEWEVEEGGQKTAVQLEVSFNKVSLFGQDSDIAVI
jgi:hypothetical protein